MKDKLIIVGIVVALVLGAVGVSQKPQVITEKLGAVMPFAPTQELNLGGLRLVGQAKSLATATSTVCAIQSPSATSTLVTAGVKFTLASTTAVLVDMYNSPIQYSTTSGVALNSANGIPASYGKTIVASSTGSTAGELHIFKPNTWFVVAYEQDTSNGANDASTGSCWATWALPQ